MIGNEEYPGIAPRAFQGLYEIIDQNNSKFETKLLVIIFLSKYFSVGY